MASSSAPLRKYLRSRFANVDTKATKKSKYSRSFKDTDISDHGLLILKASDIFPSNLWRNHVSLMEYEGTSENDQPACEIEVINDYGKVITICWVSDRGILYHYYPINDGSIRDGSVRNNHVEYTSPGHTFVAFLFKSGETVPKTINDIKSDNMIFLYQPRSGQSRHVLRVHCVDTIRDIAAVDVICKPIESEEVVDSRDKVYLLETLAGFKVQCEPGVFDCNDTLRETITFDLEALSSLLPSHVLAALHRDAMFWLNTSMCYGPISNPINATSCMYHEANGQEWLRRHGLSELKAGCIEICSAQDYLQTREHWGVGGLILHELMHCVHDRYAVGRYDCELIRQAYQKAMHAKLYEAVTVHGPQGMNRKAVKAYACANCMEFFAELSVAYLWDVDSITEYNKWYPHNREQLKIHDPDTFTALQAFWLDVDARLAESHPM